MWRVPGRQLGPWRVSVPALTPTSYPGLAQESATMWVLSRWLTKCGRAWIGFTGDITDNGSNGVVAPS